jgi:hypothetical protein
LGGVDVLAPAVGGAIDPSGALTLAGASESEIAEGPVASAVAALAAVHAARDAMTSARREMIKAGSSCLPALIVYAQRLGEHKAYKEAHRKKPSLRDDMEDAEGELEDATKIYNALVDLEDAAGGEYTERVRRYSIAIADFRVLVPLVPRAEETHEHTGDAGADVEGRALRAVRDAHKKCVDATVNAARLRGETQALGCKGDEYATKKK